MQRTVVLGYVWTHNHEDII